MRDVHIGKEGGDICGSDLSEYSVFLHHFVDSARKSHKLHSICGVSRCCRDHSVEKLYLVFVGKQEEYVLKACRILDVELLCKLLLGLYHLSHISVELIHSGGVYLIYKLADSVGGVGGSLKTETREDVDVGGLHLLSDNVAVLVFFKDIIGEILGVSDNTRDRGRGCIYLRTNNARDLKLGAVILDELCKLILGVVFSDVAPNLIGLAVVGVGLVGGNKEILGIEKCELHIKEVIDGVGLDVLGLVLLARHNRIHYALKLALIENSEHIERHLAYRVVSAYYENDLVFSLGPMTVNNVILLIEKLLIVDHLAENVYAGRARCLHKSAKAREALAHILEHIFKTELERAVRGIYLKIKVVGVLNVTYVLVYLLAICFDMISERLKIVGAGRGHRTYHRVKRVINVDLIVVVLLVAIGGRGHCFHHCGHILSLLKDRERIGRECVLLNLIDKELNSVGK